MANEIIRSEAVAKRIGRLQSGMAFPRGIFCRMLRHELPEQEQKTILKITDELELED